MLSSPGESYPEVICELYVSVSTHTTPVAKKSTTLVLPRDKHVGLTFDDLH